MCEEAVRRLISIPLVTWTNQRNAFQGTGSGLTAIRYFPHTAPNLYLSFKFVMQLILIYSLFIAPHISPSCLLPSTAVIHKHVGCLYFIKRKCMTVCWISWYMCPVIALWLIASGLCFSLTKAVSKDSDPHLETKDHSTMMLKYISLGSIQTYGQR